jgi:hypothetical protein
MSWITEEGMGRERCWLSWNELWKNCRGARRKERNSNMRQVSLNRPRRCWSRSRFVDELERKLSMEWAIEAAFWVGRDQERSGEWKRMPRTTPEVVGPKDFSNLGQGGASLTFSSWQRF